MRLALAAVLAAALFVLPGFDAQAQRCVDDEHAIVIRQTVPYPNAVRRAPLTSDQISTTSTRLIDARRGFRPFSSVYGSSHRYGYGFSPAYDDNFGITRPENRPYSYNNRTPRTSVTRYQNDTGRADTPLRDTMPLVILPPQHSDLEPIDLTIRIHEDTSARPSGRGAVLITSDGRVIQVGE